MDDKVFRDAYKLVYLIRQRDRCRVSSRDLRDVLRLAALARELVSTYIDVIEWGDSRVLRLRR
ncbi:MAG: hypothetical protein QXH99_05135 [Sulfolobales archaeon]|jgi:hypothetical protein